MHNMSASTAQKLNVDTNTGILLNNSIPPRTTPVSGTPTKRRNLRFLSANSIRIHDNTPITLIIKRVPFLPILSTKGPAISVPIIVNKDVTLATRLKTG